MGQRLYNANDGVTGRDGGPYLDEVEVRAAEERRAKIEGRKPDFDNPPATAGIQLNTAAQMVATVDVNRPSAVNTFFADADRQFSASADDKDSLLRVTAEIPDDALTNKKESEINVSTSDLEKADENSESVVFEGGNPPKDDDKAKTSRTSSSK